MVVAKLPRKVDGKGKKEKLGIKLQIVAGADYRVESVSKFSPAHAAGVQRGDLLVGIDDVARLPRPMQTRLGGKGFDVPKPVKELLATASTLLLRRPNSSAEAEVPAGYVVCPGLWSGVEIES